MVFSVSEKSNALDHNSDSYLMMNVVVLDYAFTGGDRLACKFHTESARIDGSKGKALL